MNDLNLNEDKNEILGELDLLNSFVGLAKSFIKDRKVARILTDIQNDIFVIQANIADPQNVIYLPRDISFNRIVSIREQTYWIERNLKKLNHFIIPEGITGACYLHCVRTIARQVERQLPGYLKEPTIVAQYFDHVACLMFSLARYVNKSSGYKEHPPKYFTEQNLKLKILSSKTNKRRSV